MKVEEKKSTLFACYAGKYLQCCMEGEIIYPKFLHFSSSEITSFKCKLREKTFNPIGEVKYSVNALHKFQVEVEEKK